MGSNVGIRVGAGSGRAVGKRVGIGDGRQVGAGAGRGVGRIVGSGDSVGAAVGSWVKQSFSSSCREALPEVVPQGQLVQLSPDSSNSSLHVPSGHTAQSSP